MKYRGKSGRIANLFQIISVSNTLNFKQLDVCVIPYWRIHISTKRKRVLRKLDMALRVITACCNKTYI